MPGGKRRVERIPVAWVESVGKQAQAVRVLQNAIKDMLAANAELLVLSRNQRGI